MANAENKTPDKLKEAMEAFSLENMDLTRTIVDLSGSIFLMLMTYYMGISGYSIIWIPIFSALIFFREHLWKQRQKRQLQLSQTALREKEIVTRSLKELPAWVQFPDKEKAEWLNKVIYQSWPYIGQYMQTFIREVVEPQVKAAMPGPFKSFQFEMIDMGDIPLKVGGIKVFMENVQKDEIMMDMDVAYAGDCHIIVSVGGFKAGVKQMKFSGRLRTLLKPLIPQPPLVGGVVAFFLDDPTVEFDMTGVGELAELPGLAATVKTVTTTQIRNICVLPNVIAVPLGEKIEPVRLLFSEPNGVLRVNVVEARNLENQDVIGKSDPYVKFSVGAQNFKTRVINDNLNPHWNEFFETVVDQASGQKLQLQVFDEDQAGKDEELGRLTLGISTIREKRMVDAWYYLEAAKHGDIHLMLDWMELTADPNDMEMTRRETKQPSRGRSSEPILHSSVLMVYVDKVLELPSLKKDGKAPSPVVELILGNKTMTTLPMMDTSNPVYQKKFLFFVDEPKTEFLSVEAKDSGRGEKSLGQLSIPLKLLLTEENMELYQKEWKLALGAHQSTIIMTLRLRSLKLAKFPVSNAPVDDDGTMLLKFES